MTAIHCRNGIAFFQATKFLQPVEFEKLAQTISDDQTKRYIFADCGIDIAYADIIRSHPRLKAIDWSACYERRFLYDTLQSRMDENSCTCLISSEDLEIAIAMLQRTIHGSMQNIDQLLLIKASIRYWCNIGRESCLRIALFAEPPHSFHDFMAYVAFKSLEVECFILQHSILYGGFFVHRADGSTIPDLEKNWNSASLYRTQIIEFVDRLDTSQREDRVFSFDSYSQKARLAAGNHKKKTKRLMLEECISKGLDSVLVYYANLKEAYERRAINLLDIELGAHKKIHIYPLNIAPEATTVPLGGPYYDPRIALQRITQEASEDDLILVKEHPMSFLPEHQVRFPSLRNLHYRSDSFYADLTARNNVKLMRIDQSFTTVLRNLHSYKDNVVVWSVNSTTSLESFAAGISQVVIGSFSPYARLSRVGPVNMSWPKRRDFLVKFLESSLFFISDNSPGSSMHGGISEFKSDKFFWLASRLYDNLGR